VNGELCDFRDAATGRECGRAGQRLLLRDTIGGLCIRHLCAEHSDFVEAPEAALEGRLSRADRAALAEAGMLW
jgi:hypothetical protein